MLQSGWQTWAQRVVADLQALHPDLPQQLQRADLMRWGHGMSIPLPGVRGSAALAALRAPQQNQRVHFAHSDLAGYSVFEEAFALGDAAGRAAAKRINQPRSR